MCRDNGKRWIKDTEKERDKSWGERNMISTVRTGKSRRKFTEEWAKKLMSKMKTGKEFTRNHKQLSIMYGRLFQLNSLHHL